jgi:aspartyl-tRNA(Asn)/glutamyl-tRNA(Gln) amidotransferase subunit C
MSKTVNVSHLAKLTNIPVNDAEIAKFSSQFSATLDTIKTLEELPTQHVEATPQVTNLENVFRDDVIDTSRTFSQQEALQNAKTSHNGYFVVPAVIHEN